MVRVDSKGRVTIPLFIRRELGIEADTLVELIVDQAGRALLIRPVAPSGEYLMNLNVELSTPERVSDLVNLIVESGGELKMIRCIPNPQECSVTVSVVDLRAGEDMINTLLNKGFTVKIAEESKQ
ncbi:MAG: hypothetical protein QXS42_01695 [Zestosphaera sp.]